MTGIEIFRIVGELKSFIEWFIYIKKRDVTTVRFLIDCVMRSLINKPIIRNYTPDYEWDRNI